jgi:membrane-associated phospholipid phosphatase
MAAELRPPSTGAPGAPAARMEDRGGGGPYAVDYVLIAYVLATGVLAAFAGGGRGLAMAAAHAVVAVVLLRLTRFPVPNARVLAFFRLFYPIAITPLFYAELATLNQMLFPGYFDAAVQNWEAAVFGRQLSMIADDPAFAHRWLSEILHTGYFSYYFIMPVAAAGALIAAGSRAAHRVTVTTALAFYVSYLCFAVFPVGGPRYEFVPIGGAIAEGGVYQMVHRLLESGSSRGTAFPSSHVAVSMATWLATWPASRALFWLLAPFTISLAIGTVYGRFHYGLDAAIGVLWAIVFYRLSPLLVSRLGGPERN